jgi:hypothetical protein
LTASWMFWGMVAVGGLGGIGLLAERGLVLLDRPARWSWLLVMVASVLWLFGSVVSPGGRTSAVGRAFAPSGGGAPGAEKAVEVALGGPVSVLPDALLLGGWLGPRRCYSCYCWHRLRC